LARVLIFILAWDLAGGVGGLVVIKVRNLKIFLLLKKLLLLLLIIDKFFNYKFVLIIDFSLIISLFLAILQGGFLGLLLKEKIRLINYFLIDLNYNFL
jgi:hypothetical protein